MKRAIWQDEIQNFVIAMSSQEDFRGFALPPPPHPSGAAERGRELRARHNMPAKRQDKTIYYYKNSNI